ncbi:MAG: response regulator [Lachnospiraceae bacterium]|nr:response regulator [Lachnospiraceae bacterium]
MYKAIIADDENKTCKLIQMLGDWERFSIEIAAVCTDGEEAYEAILKLHPDLVITDIRMPIYDGLQLIEKTKAGGIDTAFIIISGYRHFEYAQNALRFGIVDYLLKPIDRQQLNEVLEKTCRLLDKKQQTRQLNDRAKQIVENEYRRKQLQFLRDVLDGKFSGKAALLGEQEMKQKYEMEITAKGAFLALLLNVENQELLKEGSLFLEKTEALFSKKFRFCQYAITGTGARGIWCTLYFDMEDREKLNGAVKDFFYDVRMMEEIYGNFRPTLGIGTIETQKEHFFDSFSRAGMAEWQKMAWPNLKIHSYKPAPQTEIFAPEELAERKKALMSAMELLQAEAIPRWFEGIREAAGPSAEKLLAAYELRGEIIDVFRTYLSDYCTPAEQALADELEEKSYRCGSLHSLWDCIESAIQHFLQTKADEKAGSDKKPVLMVKQYVEEHLRDAVTLEEAAAMAGFAPAYFSNIFKKQTGQNFTEYLTEVRLTEAKRLLRDTNKSIGEIAAMTGYPDDKYFRKLFKKTVGIKASEYRKLYL